MLALSLYLHRHIQYQHLTLSNCIGFKSLFSISIVSRFVCSFHIGNVLYILVIWLIKSRESFLNILSKKIWPKWGHHFEQIWKEWVKRDCLWQSLPKGILSTGSRSFSFFRKASNCSGTHWCPGITATQEGSHFCVFPPAKLLTLL